MLIKQTKFQWQVICLYHFSALPMPFPGNDDCQAGESHGRAGESYGRADSSQRYSAAPWGNQADGTMTQYSSWPYYTDIERTSHSPILRIAKCQTRKWQVSNSWVVGLTLDLAHLRPRFYRISYRARPKNNCLYRSIYIDLYMDIYLFPSKVIYHIMYMCIHIIYVPLFTLHRLWRNYIDMYTPRYGSVISLYQFFKEDTAMQVLMVMDYHKQDTYSWSMKIRRTLHYLY